MADTYEAFYNGKPLNPNRGLPTMTYAQAEDCGLTESERLWCRTDGEDTPITAEDIPYSTGVSVKDKIDEITLTIQQGYEDIICSTAGANYTKNITFSPSYTNVPLISIAIDADGTVGGSLVAVRNVSASGFIIYAQTTKTDSPTIRVRWFAIGK